MESGDVRAEMTPFLDTLRKLTRGDKFFVSTKPLFYCRAPGRLDLMGGNDDYTGGLVFEATIREATSAGDPVASSRGRPSANKPTTRAIRASAGSPGSGARDRGAAGRGAW